MPVDPMFRTHMLNEQGKTHAEVIANGFNDLLALIKTYCPESREFSICKTKLEEACFYAKKAMANGTANQQTSST